MKITQIYDFLDKLSPFEMQAAWDNSGLLLGDFEDEVERIYLALDLDSELVENAKPNSLFITHHPLIFTPLKEISGAKYPKNLLKKMIQKNLALISMHTNYDLSHLNAYFTEQVLGFKIAKREEFIIYADIDMKFNELLGFVAKKLNLNALKFTFCGKEHIKRVAICTGSGGDLISNIDANAFLSGDFKYHQALAALESGLSLIDIGHYESESCFAKSLQPLLQNLQIKTIICVSKNPFSIRKNDE